MLPYYFHLTCPPTHYSHKISKKNGTCFPTQPYTSTSHIQQIGTCFHTRPIPQIGSAIYSPSLRRLRRSFAIAGGPTVLIFFAAGAATHASLTQDSHIIFCAVWCRGGVLLAFNFRKCENADDALKSWSPTQLQRNRQKCSGRVARICRNTPTFKPVNSAVWRLPVPT